MAKTGEKPTRFSERARPRTAPAPVTAGGATFTSEPGPTSGSEPAPAAAQEDSIKTVALRVDSVTGALQVDRMRPDTIAAVRKALDTDAARAAVFGTATATTAPAENDPTTLFALSMLLDSFGNIAANLAVRKGYSAPAAECLKFSEHEKAQLSPLAVKVLAKYDLLGGKYADEIALAIALTGLATQKIQAMNQIEALAATVAVSGKAS